MRLSQSGVLAVALAGLFTSNVHSQLFTNDSRNLGNGAVNARNSSFSDFGGTPGSQIGQMQQQAGQITGDERFLRENRQPGAFVGADTSDTRFLRSQATNFTGFDIGNVGGERSRQQDVGNQGRGQQRTMMVRRVTVGFNYREIPPQTVQRNLASRIARISSRTSVVRPDLEVAMQGRTAILRGVVESADDRLLAERLVRLEPGVSSVRNELTIFASAGTVPANPAAPPRTGPESLPAPVSPAVDAAPMND